MNKTTEKSKDKSENRRSSKMQIKVCDKNKIVEVWLTRKESSDRKLQKQLHPLYGEYKAKKYTVAVFKSGAGNLYNNTESLIFHNLKIAHA